MFASDFQNAFLPVDVDDDGDIAPIDVLVIINQLRRQGAGALQPLPPEQKPAAFYDTNGDGQLAPLDVLVVINHLNRQTPTAVDSPIYVGPNLKIERTLGTSGQTASIPFLLNGDNFSIDGSEAFLRFVVQPSSGSSLDPDAITIRNSSGSIITPVISAKDTPFSNASFSVVSIPLGRYTIDVSGENGTSGNFSLSFSPIGDSDGDGNVTDADRMKIGDLRIKQQYDSKADVNLDGLVDALDYKRGRENTGNGTSLVANAPTVGQSSDDTLKTVRKTVLSGSGSTSVLANDDFRNPFPVGSLVVSFDNTSELGASVVVNPDGSFTYDPRNVAELVSVKTGQVRIDRFTYKTSNTDESTVNIVIEGLLEGSDDSYNANEDSPLQVNAATGLLANDPVTTSTVTTFDAVSNLGAKVVVNPDGSFTYDPTTAVTLQRLQVGDSLFDYFNYQSTSNANQTTSSVVSIKVDGKNDIPLANLDLFSTTQATAVVTGNVLANDSDVELIALSSALNTGRLMVTQATTVTSLGAIVSITADGNLNYDARQVAAVPQLSRDEQLTDTFEYTVSDGVASATGKVTVSIVGLPHEVAANDDAYEVVYPHSKFIPAANGVLANDSNLDLNEQLRIVNFDRVATQGGFVTVFEDGSLLYMSGPSFFDSVNRVSKLQDGEIGIDTFSYTVTDNHGSQKTATVRFTVTGSKNTSDDEYVVNNQELLTVPADRGLFINEPFQNPRIVSSPTRSEQQAQVTVNPNDGSFTYDPRNVLSFVPDADGIVYDSFRYTTSDANNPAATFTSVARFKVFTNAQSVLSIGNDPSFNPSVSATIDQRVLKIRTLRPADFGGKISVQTIDVQGYDSQGAPQPPRVRVVAMQETTVPATATEPRKDVTQRISVADFDGLAFDSIDFEGTNGNDNLFITLSGNYPVTARGLGGNDWLQGGNGPAYLEGGDGNDTLLAGFGNGTLKGGNDRDELVGNSGNDSLDGENGNDDLFGGPGNDLLIGGNGDDYLTGGDGSDRMVGGTGADRFDDKIYGGVSDVLDDDPSLLLNVNASEGDRYSLGSTVAANSIIAGIKPGTQSFNDLSTVGGSLVVSLPNVLESLSGETSGPVLIINGPTAYGYTLKGNWSITKDGAGNETFTNTGPLTIVTGFGDVTVPTSNSAKVSFGTSADAFDGVGTLNATFNLKDFLIGLFSGTTSSSNFENQLKDIAGIELDLPVNLNVGFDLGGNIRKLNGYGSFPLADPLPYFYFNFTLGSSLVALGNNSLATSFGAEIYVAFDPLDPMLFMLVSPPEGGIDFGFAGSRNGYIPFRAENAIPSYYTRLGLGDSTFFGHIFVRASVDISEFAKNIPLTVSGDLVLDLDASDDGNTIRNVRNLADEIVLTAKNQSRNNNALKSAVGDLLGDLAVGINGQVDLVQSLPGDHLSLTIPLGGGTFLAKNQTLAFRGQSAQPFEDVPFLEGLKVAQSNIQGYYNLRNNQFAVDYSLSSPEFFGVRLSTNQQNFHVSHNGASLSGTVSTPIGLPVHVSGSLDFRTGELRMTGSAAYSIDLKIFRPSVTFDVTLSNGSSGRGLYFSGGFRAEYRSAPVDAFFTVALDFTATQSGFNIGGTASVFVDMGRPVPDFSVYAGLNNSGFFVDLGLLGRLTISW